MLDSKRLGRQRVEAGIILKAVHGDIKGWSNHPAVKMWNGYYNALAEYYNTSIEIWVARGYKNTLEFSDFYDDLTNDDPPWLGDERFHASHRSNLLRKDPEHYGKFGWTEQPNLPYFWPSKEGF